LAILGLELQPELQGLNNVSLTVSTVLSETREFMLSFEDETVEELKFALETAKENLAKFKLLIKNKKQ
jgi:hypothetical protein